MIPPIIKYVVFICVIFVAICMFLAIGRSYGVFSKSFPQTEYKLRDEFETSCINAEVVPNYKIIKQIDNEIIFQSSNVDEVINQHRELTKKYPGASFTMEDGTYQICRQYYVHIAYSVWTKQGDAWLKRAFLTTDKDKAWAVAVKLNNSGNDVEPTLGEIVNDFQPVTSELEPFNEEGISNETKKVVTP